MSKSKATIENWELQLVNQELINNNSKMDVNNSSQNFDTSEYTDEEYDYYDYFKNIILPQLSERDFLPPPLPIEIKVMLVLAYLVIIFISTVGNMMVICIICRYHKMRTVTNTFLGSLAVSTFLNTCIYVFTLRYVF